MTATQVPSRGSAPDAAAPALPEVAPLRVAQRELVRELGVTRGFETELGATLVQCHALIEIERAEGITAGDLGDRLLIEQSSASRLVDRLTASGWVLATADPVDRRRKHLVLTAAGRRQVARGHARADAEATAALGLLRPEDRQAVLRGLQLYARALQRQRRLAQVTLRPLRPGDQPAMRDIVLGALLEYQVAGRPNPAQDGDLDRLHAHYAVPGAAYWVAVEGRRVLGGAGVLPLPGVTGACELRKMYLHPAARGLGLGLRLLERCLDGARAAGFTSCCLNTLSRMRAAIRLYEGVGFVPIAAPVADHLAGCDRWYRLAL